MVQTNCVFEIHSTFFHTSNDILHDFRGAAHPTPKVASTYNTSGESGATALLVLTLRERTHEFIVVCQKKRIVILLQTAYNTPTSIDNTQDAFKHTLSFIGINNIQSAG
jgi:hypothetical protein